MKILLLGSSIIRQWKPQITPNTQIINKGISRMQTKHLFHPTYMEIKKVKDPDYIIFHIGGNDIKNNMDPTENIGRFLQVLKDHFINTKIIVIPIIKTPIFIDEGRTREINKINRNLKEICKVLNIYKFRDINRLLISNETCFVKDRYHISEKGYRKIDDDMKKILVES